MKPPSVTRIALPLLAGVLIGALLFWLDLFSGPNAPRWLKAFHIIFMVAWFAGLFYVPRLFVYHCGAHDAIGHARFCTMERRLLRLATVAAVLTIGFGTWLLLQYWMPPPLWLQVKLALALGLIAFHLWLWSLYRSFENYRNRHSERFYRWINELPTVFLVAMVILAVLKPS